LSFGAGFSTSLICRTSGGPYFVHTMAFMIDIFNHHVCRTMLRFVTIEIYN
jgi:hypothetical protein